MELGRRRHLSRHLKMHKTKLQLKEFDPFFYEGKFTRKTKIKNLGFFRIRDGFV